MSFIDLTHIFDEHISLFPGTKPPIIEKNNTIKQDGFSQLKIMLLTHMGTHIDAPFHILPAGKKLDAFGIEKFQGKAIKLDWTEQTGTIIPVAALEPMIPLLEQAAFLILFTGWSEYWKTNAYKGEYPVLSEDAAQFLTQFNLKGIGMDTFSPDPIDSKQLPIHKILLQKEILIIENLSNLEQLPNNQLFEFWAMPLNIFQADGSPVRAFAQID